MDIVPVVAAILFSPLDGFSFIYGDDGSYDVYFYSQINSYEEVQLRCESGSGSYITFYTSYVMPENVNQPYSDYPVRRAVFEDFYSRLPEECVHNKVHYVFGRVEADEYSPCFESYSTYEDITITLSIFHDGKRVGMSSKSSEDRILKSIANEDNILVAVNSSGRVLDDVRVEGKKGFYKTHPRTYSGGELSPYDGRPCFATVEEAESSYFVVDFGSIVKAVDYITGYDLSAGFEYWGFGIEGGSNFGFAPDLSDIYIDPTELDPKYKNNEKWRDRVVKILPEIIKLF